MWMIHSDEEGEALRDLVKSSDRSSAIVAAALLENRLQYAIITRMAQDETIINQLFHSSGPLGSFSAKIKLGYLIKMYSQQACAEMTCIKDIRNDFAHKLGVRDFQTPTVRDKAKNLKMVERHIFPFGTKEEDTPQGLSPKMFEHDLDAQLSDPRRRYLLAVSFFVNCLTPIGRYPDLTYKTPF